MLMVPTIPLNKHDKNGLEKALFVVSRMKQHFGLIIYFSPLTISIRKTSPVFREKMTGGIEEYHPEFSLWRQDLQFCFKCEGNTGYVRLAKAHFTEETVKMLMYAYTHPDQFDILASTKKNRWKFGKLSKII